ncbi:GatB/YqeY domain-containing protein [Alkaliflexus imshenetskii]|uniref:GatB/YqeY domain-containing protein n=1 Tax=Alkaliflexus imshenetskii TaxID=286730 RepID=UPI00047A8BF5|nr:GatB/YqeY domain-containing protein [Alkaliflexus imshenetskii]
MSIFERINDDIKSAMKAREQIRLDTLRGIKKELIEARTAKNAGGVVSDEDEIRLLQKMVKQRRDAAGIYNAQGRADLANKEELEVDIISEYLPEPLSPEELEAAVKEIISAQGATSMQEMGKVMGAATAALGGKAEGKDISQMVKKLLS